LNPALRHRAESAWFILSAVLLAISLWAIFTSDPEDIKPASGRTAAAGPLVFIVLLGFALYSPSLFVGLLSDDFVLLERAKSGALVDQTWDYVRPLPLLVWRVLDYFLPDPIVPRGLHALNIALHGLNAWLVYRLATALSFERYGATLAAVLFLSWPFSVEPVAWASGIFDLLLTTLALLSVLTVLQIRGAARSAVLITLLTSAALATKETAVALPLLLAAIYPFVPHASRRQAIGLVGLSAVIVTAYVVWRITTGLPDTISTAPSGYAVKEVLSRPFGVLGIGLHRMVFDQMPALPVLLALLWPVLAVRPALHPIPVRGSLVIIMAGCLWVLFSVLPLFTMLFVGPDLQGSRYLYLGSSLWSVAVVAMATPTVASAPGRPALAALLLMATISVTATRMHQRPWLQATTTVQHIISAARNIGSTCASAEAIDLPDNVDGAYIFRNGFGQAFAMSSPHTPGGEHCRILWNGQGFQLLRP